MLELTLLHLGDELLVEEATRFLVQRAVDGDHVALGQQLLEGVDAAAADLLLDLRLEGLVVEIEELLAVEGLETAQHTLADTPNGYGTDRLALEIELVLGGGCDVPFASLDLLVCRHEVTYQDQDGHDDVLSYRYNVGAGDLGHRNTTVGFVGNVEVDMVGADTGSDGKLEFLRLG